MVETYCLQHGIVTFLDVGKRGPLVIEVSKEGETTITHLGKSRKLSELFIDTGRNQDGTPVSAPP
ncbi:MAG: hypothetical protein ABIE68_00940 [bacterium]